MKLEKQEQMQREGKVAPLAGAWIEIPSGTPIEPPCCRSLLSQERGLKFDDGTIEKIRKGPLLSQERGLK